ncbi:MAG: hypothetical protein ACTSVB_08055 [Candidatus Heimdallarchaeaceae archaeon]
MKEEINAEVLEFLKAFSNISIDGLYEILEYLNGMGYLGDKGKEFYHNYWEDLIKEES